MKQSCQISMRLLLRVPGRSLTIAAWCASTKLTFAWPGRWKGTLVAIKVVEHAPVAGDGMSAEQHQVEREALLASNLSHPNVIATWGP